MVPGLNLGLFRWLGPGFGPIWGIRVWIWAYFRVSGSGFEPILGGLAWIGTISGLFCLVISHQEGTILNHFGPCNLEEGAYFGPFSGSGSGFWPIWGIKPGFGLFCLFSLVKRHVIMGTEPGAQTPPNRASLYSYIQLNVYSCYIQAGIDTFQAKNPLEFGSQFHHVFST